MTDSISFEDLPCSKAADSDTSPPVPCAHPLVRIQVEDFSTTESTVSTKGMVISLTGWLYRAEYFLLLDFIIKAILNEILQYRQNSRFVEENIQSETDFMRRFLLPSYFLHTL